MSPTKKFLIGLVVVYLIVAISLNIALGSPGLSKGYLADHSEAHDRYLDITKSDPYKLYKQRPHLQEPDAQLAASIEFVAEYEQNPLFLAEQARIWWRLLVFNLLNAATLIALAVRFLRKPLAAFLNDQVEQVRNRIEKAEQARAEAASNKEVAQAKLDEVDTDREQIASHARERADEEARAIAEATEHQLAQLEQETAERKDLEEHRAAMELKRQLVTHAVEQLEQQLRTTDSQKREDVLVGQFIAGLERPQ